MVITGARSSAMTVHNVICQAVGFVPGFGWAISGSYFVLNTGLELSTGKSIGQHLFET
jgi:hypothetical protein